MMLELRRRGLVLFVSVALWTCVIVTLIYLNRDHRAFDGFANLSNSFLGGNIKQNSCLSRGASSSYRKSDSKQQQSAYLVTKLGEYEDLHRRCGPNSRGYRRTMKELAQNERRRSVSVSVSGECSYVVWRGAHVGLGNQMLSTVSAFLYALLTNRVLLVDFGADDAKLFCEPFLSSSWILPHDFPHKENDFGGLETFQTLMMEEQEHLRILPNFLYVDLISGSFDRVKYFHCDQGHSVLRRIPVVVIRSDLYYVPSLFMTPSFTKVLQKMFPNGNKATVFHHLGRYLFHPSNEAWEQITKYYNDHLAKVDIRIGLQIRLFNTQSLSQQSLMDQILSCSQDYHILPMLQKQNSSSSSSSSSSSPSTALLVVSLFSEYANNLTAMYNQSAGGDTNNSHSHTNNVRVYQPSTEGQQKFNDPNQNMKAWVEMYLLSLCDKLVTTGGSTFGYVAQGLGGINPWVLGKQDSTANTNSQITDCWRAPTIDPCFHFPSGYDCNANMDIGHSNLTHLFPQIKICEDRWFGFRLTDAW